MSLVFLSAQTASNSASLKFTGIITSSYDTYEIHGISIIPATDGAKIGLRCSTNGGSSYDSGNNYDWTAQAVVAGGTGSNGATSTSVIEFTNGQSSGGSSALSWVVTLCDPLNAALKKYLHGTAAGADTSGTRLIGWWIAGVYKITTAVDAFQILASTGNITSGIVRVYGVSES